MNLRCRTKKIRCDRKTPCTTCTQANEHCLQDTTSKKFHVFEEDIKQLENKLIRLENTEKGLDAADQGLVELERPYTPSDLVTSQIEDADLQSGEEENGTSYTDDLSWTTTWPRQDATETNAKVAESPLESSRTSFPPVLSGPVATTPTNVESTVRRRDNSELTLSESFWLPGSGFFVLFVIAPWIISSLTTTFSTPYYSIDTSAQVKQAGPSIATCVVGLGGALSVATIARPSLQRLRVLMRLHRSSMGSTFEAPNIAFLFHQALPVSVLQFMRPKTRPGYQRLEWKCSCGRAMYGDYASHDAIETSALLQYLPECKVVQK